MRDQRWVLKRRPQGSLSHEDLALPGRGSSGSTNREVLWRNLYLSIDPTQRIWMSDRDQYMPPKWKVHVVAGLDNAPDAFACLFRVGHADKLLVRVSPEPD